MKDPIEKRETRRHRAYERADEALRLALIEAGLRHDQNTLDCITATLLVNGHDVKAVRR